mmetsp:Transcript_48683/g.66316  ORF Transcript_48683/g.66316 Transcript_48683/m.66316 type:complete len:135 (-) Transcript_48683:250-654(-)
MSCWCTAYLQYSSLVIPGSSVSTVFGRGVVLAFYPSNHPSSCPSNPSNSEEVKVQYGARYCVMLEWGAMAVLSVRDLVCRPDTGANQVLEKENGRLSLREPLKDGASFDGVTSSSGSVGDADQVGGLDEAAEDV